MSKGCSLIADSGGTKTTWLCPDTGGSMQTIGLNPHATSDDEFIAAATSVATAFGKVIEVSFYGAGCGSIKQCERVNSLLRRCFPEATLSVGTDMLLACRATLNNQPGIAAILGTGANICHFDGKEIDCQPPSTGYILGDRGSACHVGRLLSDAFLRGLMPENLARAFMTQYGLGSEDIIEAVYHQPAPARFLASLAPFATGNADNQFCRAILMRSIEEWWNDAKPLMERYSCRDISFVGSYAAAIEPLLRQFLHRHDVNVRQVIAHPLDSFARGENNQ